MKRRIVLPPAKRPVALPVAEGTPRERRKLGLNYGADGAGSDGGGSTP